MDTKVSEVLMEIVSQTKRGPTAREVRLKKEIIERLDGKPVKDQDGQTGFLAGAVKVVPYGLGHRGPGCLVGGAYGSQQPRKCSPFCDCKGQNQSNVAILPKVYLVYLKVEHCQTLS